MKRIVRTSVVVMLVMLITPILAFGQSVGLIFGETVPPYLFGSKQTYFRPSPPHYSDNWGWHRDWFLVRETPRGMKPIEGFKLHEPIRSVPGYVPFGFRGRSAY